MTDIAWQAIFDEYQIYKHNFDEAPFYLSVNQIKVATAGFGKTGEREPRILCKQDTRESRPKIFQELGLFILPIKNGEYAILKGEGYVDIPLITQVTETYISQLDFPLRTAQVGNSEMQHLDFAYATSLIRSFMQDESLVLTIRGRKYTPLFSFKHGQHKIQAGRKRVKIDRAYEGRDQVLLVKLIKSTVSNISLAKIYYPFRLIAQYTVKPINILIFQVLREHYQLYLGRFLDAESLAVFRFLDGEYYQIKV